MRITDLTVEQLKALIREIVEEELTQYLGDPDDGLELREEFKQRLLQSVSEDGTGVRGVPLEQVARELRIGLGDPVIEELSDNKAGGLDDGSHNSGEA